MKKNNNVLMIFDWDDTLFPTTWLISSGIRLTDENSIKKIMVYLHELDIHISKLLKTAIMLGKVIIVTNAGIEWIMLSKKYLPKTSYILDNYIKIISARDIYHHAYEIIDWKKNVFKNNILSLVNWSNQIISFGDAYYEFNALISLYDMVPRNKYLKNVKLFQGPTFDILIDQLNVLNNYLEEIVREEGHLDLNFMKM